MDSSGAARELPWLNDGTARVTRGAVMALATRALQEVAIGEREPLLEAHARRPAEGLEAPHVHQLAWRAVGLGAVELDAALVSDGPRHLLGKLADADVLARADVDVRKHRLRVLRVLLLRQEHHVHAGRGHVVDVEELAARRAATPDGDARRRL